MTTAASTTLPAARSVITDMAQRFGMERTAFEATIKKTILPANTDVSNEQLVAFLVVAKEYNLSPFTKEIYAFPSRGGGIQPIVSIDGWLKIINSHPQFNGMEYEDDHTPEGKLLSVTCRIFRKDRDHAIEVTEYMDECRRDTDTWKRWPARMLRHKATIQCARYAFGFSGIVDPDEAERLVDVRVIEVEPSEPARPVRGAYSDEEFKAKLETFRPLIQSGQKDAEDIITMVESKTALSEEQKQAIRKLAPIEGEVA
jgi:phage recombination protein Bet